MSSASHRSRRSTSVAVALLAVHALHAKAEVGATLGTRLAHSDNVALLSEDAEHSESIAEVTAGINYARTAQRHDTNISYQAQGIFYDESSDSNEVFNSLNASSQLGLVLDRLFLDLYAVHDQTVVDPSQAYSFNNLALTGNRTDVSIVGASPSVRISIGANVTGEVRYGDARVDYDDETLDDRSERFSVFTLGNSNSRRGPTWQVAYNRQEYDYEAFPEIQFETFSLQLGIWVSDVLRLFTTQGLESDYTLVAPSLPNAEGPGLDEHFWDVGIDWRPSDRTELVAASGQRSFGESHRLQWTYRTERGGISLGYVEEPSSFLREQLHSLRSTGELSPIDSLDGPNGNPFYLQKRTDLTFLLQRPRSGAALRVFDERRFDIVDAVTDSLSDETERYRGTELSLSWSLSARSKIGLSRESARRRSIFNVTDDEIRNLTMSFERGIGRQGTLLLTASQERVDPKSAIGQIKYNENQASISIRRWFGTASSGGVPQRYSDYLNADQGY